jgi:hypothetical protein
MTGRANPKDRGAAPVAYPGTTWSDGFGWNRDRLKNSEGKPTSVGFFASPGTGIAQGWNDNELNLLKGGWDTHGKMQSLEISGLNKFQRYDLYLPSQHRYSKKVGGTFTTPNASDSGTDPPSDLLRLRRQAGHPGQLLRRPPWQDAGGRQRAAAGRHRGVERIVSGEHHDRRAHLRPAQHHGPVRGRSEAFAEHQRAPHPDRGPPARQRQAQSLHPGGPVEHGGPRIGRLGRQPGRREKKAPHLRRLGQPARHDREQSGSVRSSARTGISAEQGRQQTPVPSLCRSWSRPARNRSDKTMPIYGTAAKWRAIRASTSHTAASRSNRAWPACLSVSSYQ